jgi:hypothetical protein
MNSSAATKLSLLTRIKTLYSHELNLLVQDRFPFNIDIEDWEHKTGTAMKQWLAKNTPFMKHALKIAKLQLKKNASDIRRFYKTKPNQRRKPNDAEVRSNRRISLNLPKNRHKNKREFKHQRRNNPEQATLLGFTTTRTQHKTAQPETQNT